MEQPWATLSTQTIYKPGALPPLLYRGYKQLLKARIDTLRGLKVDSSWTDPAIPSLKHDLARPDCFTAVHLIEEKAVAFAFVVDCRKSLNLVYIGEVQVHPDHQYEGIAETLLRFIQTSFPSDAYYGVVHKHALDRLKLYQQYGITATSVWFPELHQYRTKEHWTGIYYGRLSFKLKQLVLILCGVEKPIAKVGIKVDAKNIKRWFKNEPCNQSTLIEILDAKLVQTQNLIQKIEGYAANGITKAVIIYSGHGKNDGSTDFAEFQWRDETVSLMSIHNCCKRLFEMSVVGADCCNVADTSDAYTSKLDTPSRRADPFSATGHLVFTSSKRGQTSAGHPIYGGLFLRNFLLLFDGLWLPSLERARDAVAKESSGRQIAHWEPAEDWQQESEQS